MNPEFLTVDDVFELHALQLERYGGMDGVRDLNLLESAVLQAQAGFGGEFVHEDIFAMGAAYLFHLVKNHAFLDGNKRVGLLACLTFLELNGFELTLSTDQLYDITLAVAEGRMNKTELAAVLRSAA